MFKVIVTDAIISKGYDGAQALRFSENGDGVRFRIGKKVYDPKAENNTRWVNLPVKAFGSVCERIRKMQLKECSVANLMGRLDEEVWTDQRTNETRSTMVIILEEVEYASGGGTRSRDDQNQQSANAGSAPAPAANAAQSTPQNSSNFTGYEPFGTGSFFDEN